MVESKYLETPILLFSLDTELAWGFHDKDELPKKRIESARSSLRDILRLFDKYDIAATWAVVGHLFLDECDGNHEEHPLGKEWFEKDSGGNVKENLYWFGTDLIREILDAKVDHEIGCHSFSHPEFNTINREMAEWELQNSLDAAKKIGIDLESFVFPRNKVGHHDLLKEYGFTSYRGQKPPSWYDKISLERKGNLNYYFNQTGRLIDFTVVRNSKLSVTPIIDKNGLVNIPASLYIFSFERARAFPETIARKIVENIFPNRAFFEVKRGIESILNNNGILHLWFHPNDLKLEKDFQRLVKICRYIKKIKEESELEVKTMQEVAREVIERR